MNETAVSKTYPFLAGGGEMGSLIRKKDWSSTAVGPIENWPQSLRTTLGIILNSKFPMFLWWGKEELICFYNDDYRPSLGENGKHPQILGMPAKEAWPEIWPVIGPLIDKVLAGEYSHWAEDQLIPIYRNGKLEDVYWTFSYSPVSDESGNISGVLVVCSETTAQVLSRKKIEEDESIFRNMSDHAPVVVWTMDETANTTFINKEWTKLTGLSLKDIVGEGWKNVVHREDVEKVDKAFKKAIAGKEEMSIEYRIKDKNGNYRWIIDTAKPRFDESQHFLGHIGSMVDIDERVRSEHAVREAEQKFRNNVLQAPVGIAVLRGKDFLVETANSAYRELIDKDEAQLIGLKLFEVLPEVKDAIGPLLNNVLETGVAFHATELPAPLNRFGKIETGYFNLVYQPLKEPESENVSGIMVVATEVTEQVNFKQLLAESEKQFRNMVMQSPIPMTIFKGQDFVIDIANNEMINNVWRKKERDVIGKKLLDVFPELNDQKYPRLLNNVFTTGDAYRENESVAYVQGNDGMQKFYLDFEYAAVKEPSGKIYGIMVTVNNVTEKVEARKKIEESENRLSMAIAVTKLGTWDYNPSTGNLNWSKECRDIYGFPAGKTVDFELFSKHIYEEDKDFALKSIDEALDPDGTGLYDIVFRIIRFDDGSMRWIRSQGKVEFDTNRKPEMFIGTVLDITDDKKAEEESARMAAIVQSSEDAIISKTLAGIVTSWNDGAERVFGYTAAEMIGQPIIKLLPQDRLTEEFNIIERIKKGKRVEHFETKRLKKGGQLIDVSISISPIKDVSGKILGASKIGRDITEQKKAEQMMQESEGKFRILADSMPQFVWSGDKDGNLNYFSKGVYDYSGLSIEQVAKEGWLQIVHPDDRDENIKQWTHSIETGTTFIFEHRFRRADGEYRWQLSRALPQKDNKGKIQMWVGTSTDIDEIKRHEQQKDDFIKIASHELKTPITTVKGYVQLLLKTHGAGNDSFLSGSLLTINKQISKLTKLITDLLDVTKIETGSLSLSKESFSINDIVKEIAADMKAAHSSHSIEIHSNANPKIYADKDRISQVLNNLFTNAIKYSPNADKVIVEINVEGKDVIVSVTDLGIGIATKDQAKIFERFYRASGKDEKTFPGFGIGLFIVNEIISLHGGKIWVESKKEKGSTFKFSLPVY